MNALNKHGRPSSRMTFDYGRLGSLAFERYTPQDESTARITFIDYRIAGHLHSLGADYIDVVMTTKNVQALSVIVRHLHKFDSVSNEGLRRLADRLERGYAGTDEFQANALSFICLILAKNAGEQYEALLQRVESDSGTRRLKKHAREAMAMIRRAKENSDRQRLGRKF